MSLRASTAELMAELVSRGLLIESGVAGVYAHAEPFERVRAGLGSWMTSAAVSAGAEQMRFPPVLPRRTLEDVGYLANFPHLAGSVFSFDGSEREASEMAATADRHEDWSAFQQPTELCLVPAACYPIYPAVAARGPVGANGLMVEAGPSWVFRHEPSDDPTRRQIFHQHELVWVGSEQSASRWREDWSQRVLDFTRELGLDARLAPASDPFFGRRGRLLASSQREQELKLEMLIDIVGSKPTACASFNLHLERFAELFGITSGTNEPACTSCLGVGHERLTTALLCRHGFDPDRWPASVTSMLWP